MIDTIACKYFLKPLYVPSKIKYSIIHILCNHRETDIIKKERIYFILIYGQQKLVSRGTP